MIETVRNAWKVPELRKKIMFTIFALLIFRLGSAVPVPYIDSTTLETYLAAQSGTILGLMNAMSGSAFSMATVFALSIQPYINASIIIQLLTVAIPALERLAKEGGEEGRKKIASITRYTTVAIGLLQGFGYYTLIKSYGLVESGSVNGIWAGIVIVLTFTAGTALIMWLGEHITQNGVGNGISIILFAGIISRGPALANSLLNLVKGGAKNAILAALMVIIGLALVVFIVYMSNAERRIPIQYAKRVVGRKMYGGQSTFLPIKVNATGVMPIIFASSILSLPSTVFMFYTPQAGSIGSVVKSLFSQNNPFYIVLYAILIIAFSYFYASIQFNPIEIANNLKKNGGFIPGFRPGKPTADFITKALAKVVFVGALFLGVVALLPLIVGAFSNSLSNVAVGGTSVIIVVGVALETVKQIEAQLMMRHHKGFLE